MTASEDYREAARSEAEAIDAYVEDHLRSEDDVPAVLAALKEQGLDTETALATIKRVGTAKKNRAVARVKRGLALAAMLVVGGAATCLADLAIGLTVLGAGIVMGLFTLWRADLLHPSRVAAFRRRAVNALRRRMFLWRKRRWQRRHLDQNTTKRPIFLMGCHRSGTTMAMLTFERSFHTEAWHEGHNEAFEKHRLREPVIIKEIVARSPSATVLFKPVCDTHLTDEFLDEYDESLALFFFRNYRDVANSVVRKWGPHQALIMKGIAHEAWDLLGWRGERLDEEAISTVKSIWSEDMTPHDGAAMQWWLRNRFYYTLGLDHDPRVLLVKYEDLVTQPEPEFGRIFDFMKCPFDPAIVKGIFTTSIGRDAHVELDPRIVELCDALLERLEATYASKRSAESAQGAVVT